MKKTERETWRQRLQSMLERMQPDVETITERSRAASGGQGTTELSNLPMHLADGGTEEYLHELNTTLLENEEFLLAEVQAALDRLDNDAFGNCQHCGGKIAKARLQALPYTRFCIECASAMDQPQANLNHGRARSPADTLADEEEMEIRARDRKSTLTDTLSSQQPRQAETDVHAAGTPGGGAAIGGIAGSTKGDGSPDVHELQEAMGSGDFDATEGEEEDRLTPTADRSGRAVAGTPATRR